MANLAGLYHPLLEPLQVKIDGPVDHRSSQESLGHPESWHYRLQTTVGLSSSLRRFRLSLGQPAPDTG